MLKADDVCSILYNFSLGSFRKFAGMPDSPVDLPSADWLFSTFTDREAITADDVAAMPAKEARAMYEILTQYIMFLTMNPHLWYPDEFLLGSSGSRLGTPLLQYFAEHRWPFPQMISKGQPGAVPEGH